MEQYICSVGQIFPAMGTLDSRFNRVGSIDFFLGRKIAAYKREDPPPTRAPPSAYIHCPHPGRCDKVAQISSKLSPTSPGSNSSSYCDLESTAKAAPTQSPHLYNYGTYNYSLAIIQPQPPPKSHKNALQQPLSVSSSPIRRTNPKVNRLATALQ